MPLNLLALILKNHDVNYAITSNNRKLKTSFLKKVRAVQAALHTACHPERNEGSYM